MAFCQANKYTTQQYESEEGEMQMIEISHWHVAQKKQRYKEKTYSNCRHFV